MTHADRELLVLHLYGELDPEEAAALESRLAASPELAAFAAELQTGLGAFVRADGTDADLPTGWRERLDGSLEARPIAWGAVAVGLAAGLLLSLLFPRSAPEVPTRPGAGPAFVLAQPPPLSTTKGPLARLGAYLDG